MHLSLSDGVQLLLGVLVGMVWLAFSYSRELKAKNPLKDLRIYTLGLYFGSNLGLKLFGQEDTTIYKLSGLGSAVFFLVVVSILVFVSSVMNEFSKMKCSPAAAQIPFFRSVSRGLTQLIRFHMEGYPCIQERLVSCLEEDLILQELHEKMHDKSKINLLSQLPSWVHAENDFKNTQKDFNIHFTTFMLMSLYLWFQHSEDDHPNFTAHYWKVHEDGKKLVRVCTISPKRFFSKDTALVELGMDSYAGQAIQGRVMLYPKDKKKVAPIPKVARRIEKFVCIPAINENNETVGVLVVDSNRRDSWQLEDEGFHRKLLEHVSAILARLDSKTAWGAPVKNA